MYVCNIPVSFFFKTDLKIIFLFDAAKTWNIYISQSARLYKQNNKSQGTHLPSYSHDMRKDENASPTLFLVHQKNPLLFSLQLVTSI